MQFIPQQFWAYTTNSSWQGKWASEYWLKYNIYYLCQVSALSTTRRIVRPVICGTVTHITCKMLLQKYNWLDWKFEIEWGRLRIPVADILQPQTGSREFPKQVAKMLTCRTYRNGNQNRIFGSHSGRKTPDNIAHALLLGKRQKSYIGECCLPWCRCCSLWYQRLRDTYQCGWTLCLPRSRWSRSVCSRETVAGCYRRSSAFWTGQEQRVGQCARQTCGRRPPLANETRYEILENTLSYTQYCQMMTNWLQKWTNEFVSRL